MSRGNRAGKSNSGAPTFRQSKQLAPAGFAKQVPYIECPDCVDNELSPPENAPSIRHSNAPFRVLDPAGVETTKCETCKGTRRIPTGPRSDPYMTPIARDA